MKRIVALDMLKGLAVILMVEQHLGIWLWTDSQNAINFPKYYPLIGFNAMGGFAAPAFITIAGAGTVFLSTRHGKGDSILVKRGLMILFFGYMLNVIIPSWFSPGSWYVLHMIGFGIILSPLLKRLTLPLQVTAMFLCLAVSVVLQNYLDTPSFIYNEFMRDTGRPGGIFRLAMAESQFPVFPWLSLFIAGIITGKWIMDDKLKPVIIFAALLLLTGTILCLVNIAGFDIAKNDSLKRVFWYYLGFYPANPPIILILASLVQFSLVLFIRLDRKFTFSESNPLISTGRLSLTILFLHVFIFRELGVRYKFWRLFSAAEAFGIILLTIIFFIVLSIFWKKSSYKFSLEWILRKFD